MAIIVSDSLVVRIAKKEGEKVSTLGICPAIADPTFNVFNQGINTSKIYCFLEGTFCRGKVQGSFTEQQAFCESCEFYKQLHAEELTTNIHADNKNIILNTHLERVRELKEERKFLTPVLLPPFNSEIVYSEQLEEPNAFDNQIEVYEKEAQEKYEAAVKDLQDVELSGWLNCLLERRIISGLRRIGFGESIDWALFKMAVPSWNLMGPISDKDVLFHPVLIREIEEIRSNIILKAKRNSEASLLLKSFNPQELLSFAKKMMHPGNLFELIEDISTSWIILPRAYDHLKEHHSRYLPGYLNYLYNETNLAFAKILTRIIIEFMGNYTLKYISEIHPKNQMIHALFYGYAAMFWRNLRNPPNGFEHIGIFENFLYWAKMFQNRFPFISCDMARIIESMEDEKEKAFPVINTFGLASDSQIDAGRFLVTLRHGDLGIEAAIKYFGPGGPLLKNATDGRLPYAAVPAALSVLFKEIKKSYYHEAPQTQGFIREFLLKLKAVYDLERLNMIFPGGELPEHLRFAGPRAIGMINDLTALTH